MGMLSEGVDQHNRHTDAVCGQVAEACGALNVAHSQLVRLAREALDNELWQGWGIRSIEHWLAWQAGLSPARAKQVADIARRYQDLPETMAAFAAGELSVDQVAAVVAHTPKHNDGEAARFAKIATVSQIRRTLSKATREPEPEPDESDESDESAESNGAESTAADDGAGNAPDDPVDPEEAERRRREEDDRRVSAREKAWMGFDGRRFFLRLDAPPDVGALVREALTAAHNQLFNSGHSDTTLADALIEICRRYLAPDRGTAREAKSVSDADPDSRGGPASDGADPETGTTLGADAAPAAGAARGAGAGTDIDPVVGNRTTPAAAPSQRENTATPTGQSRQSKYRVYVHLNASASWVSNGPTLPETLRRKLTCDGLAAPVWERNGYPVNVGRSMRIVPEHTRRLVEDRDRGCVFPGCHSTMFLEVHHLVHWADGGATNSDNLTCLCPYHHDAHHRGEFSISGDARDPNQLVFTTAEGHRIPPVGRPRPPTGPLPGPTTPYQHPIGERMDLRWLHFTEPPAPTRKKPPPQNPDNDPWMSAPRPGAA